MGPDDSVYKLVCLRQVPFELWIDGCTFCCGEAINLGRPVPELRNLKFKTLKDHVSFGPSENYAFSLSLEKHPFIYPFRAFVSHWYKILVAPFHSPPCCSHRKDQCIWFKRHLRFFLLNWDDLGCCFAYHFCAAFFFLSSRWLFIFHVDL